jgi:hypothetical protein
VAPTRCPNSTGVGVMDQRDLRVDFSSPKLHSEQSIGS